MVTVILRPYLYDETACASYLFGCLTERKLGVVDTHEGFVDAYLEESEGVGAPIVAVFETHLQADHVSGLPALVEATEAAAYLPARAGVEIPLMQTLLDYGANINGLPGGWNPLLAALHNGRREAAEFLAARGARLDLEGAAGSDRDE